MLAHAHLSGVLHFPWQFALQLSDSLILTSPGPLESRGILKRRRKNLARRSQKG